MKENTQYQDDENLKGSQTEQFLHLLLPNEKRIFAFILSLVPNRSDADDILQDAITVMWRKFSEYQLGTDFVAWGVTIAKYRILKFRTKNGNSKIQFSENAINLLQKDSGDLFQMMDSRLDALKMCVKKLCTNDLELIQMRYEQDIVVQKIAERFGRSVQAIYKRLAKIHYMLAKCIKKTLSVEGV